MDTTQTEKPSEFVARARVQITVEYYCSQPWSPDATLKELCSGAENEALQRVRQLNLPIIGQARVIAMFTEKSRDKG